MRKLILVTLLAVSLGVSAKDQRFVQCSGWAAIVGNKDNVKLFNDALTVSSLTLRAAN